MRSQEIYNKLFDLLFELEGIRLKAYKDTGGIWTIGVGTTHYPDGRAVKSGDTCTREQAIEWMKHESNSKISAVDKYVTASLNDNEWIALVSFTYNVGVGKPDDPGTDNGTGLRGSTLLKLLNGGKPRAEVADQFDRWIKDNGKVVQGLINRRAKEKKLFLTPDVNHLPIDADIEIETPAWFEPFKKWIVAIVEKLFGPAPVIVPDNPDESQASKIIRLNPHIEPLMIKRAMKERAANISKFSKNEKYMSLVDFSKADYEERFYFIDMDTCKAIALPEKGIAAHGKKSDQNQNQFPETFSNVSGSNCSTLGLKRFAESYNSSKKKTGSNFAFTKSRRIDGLDSKLNGNERPRACVLHDGFYVTIARALAKNVGDSLGCLVLTQKVLYFIFDKVEGSMLYCWHPQLEE